MFIMKILHRARFVLAAFAMMAVQSAALAEESQAAEATRQEFDAAFAQMFEDPSNVVATMQYATLAVALKDYEAAIPPLERLLMYNPDLPEIRLQVGVLYYLLDSRAMAKKYLEQVTKDKHATPEMVRQAEEYLANM